MDFSGVKAITIPEGSVKKITAGGVVIWQKPPTYTNLVPTARNTDGTILDGIGYRKGAYWNGTVLGSNSSFTAIGAIAFGNGTIPHDIYIYGINFTGTTNNRIYLLNSAYSSLDGNTGIKDGLSNSKYTITKLADNYFKISTKAYSTKIAYFAISGVTASGITPIVTLDEPIF